MKIDELLDATVDELLTRDWKQDGYGSDNGSKCVVGATTYVWFGSIDNGLADMERLELARHLLNLSILPIAEERGWRRDASHMDVTDWNDAPDRDLDEVIEVLRLAAKRQREATQT